MKIGLVSYRCRNGDTAFNLRQIERAMRDARGKADLLCFGEAFLQGFDSLRWEYETDRRIAVEQSSETVDILRDLTVRYGAALLTGYIEKDRDCLFSSCIVIDKGETVRNYRRISRGWKEFTRTDSHYREGDETGEFTLRGETFMPALCGDLWDFPERFRTEHTLIWPVYVNYSTEDWAGGVLDEYARQAALAAKDTLMVNPLDDDPVNHGGSFRFTGGTVAGRIPFDEERILFTDTGKA